MNMPAIAGTSHTARTLAVILRDTLQTLNIPKKDRQKTQSPPTTLQVDRVNFRTNLVADKPFKNCKFATNYNLTF
jgi:hypothetical protein